MGCNPSLLRVKLLVASPRGILGGGADSGFTVSWRPARPVCMGVGLLAPAPCVSPFSGLSQRKSFSVALQIERARGMGSAGGTVLRCRLGQRRGLSREVQQTSASEGYEGTGGPAWGFRGLP